MNWDHIYHLESQIGQFVGAKERFIILAEVKNKLLNTGSQKLRILDGGGCPITSALLKKNLPRFEYREC